MVALLFLGIGMSANADMIKPKTDDEKIHQFNLTCVWQDLLTYPPSAPYPYRAYVCMEGQMLFIPELSAPPRPKPKNPLPWSDPSRRILI